MEILDRTKMLKPSQLKQTDEITLKSVTKELEFAKNLDKENSTFICFSKKNPKNFILAKENINITEFEDNKQTKIATIKESNVYI